ncbi:DedA family protein [Heyndrickxia oleronia]|uniref:DedA family protein n=1 Tax=Heyndrickxia oleronia TaxID=38875 RepID=UPI00242D0686|nr:DedA family protein [Heyndrickxia oleronia]MCI1593651.1 DedA family protein [Heyndrickxia oleronia]MCI1616017.1 DedA family protein [Heyndrickxia oleronia]MCI1746600.1 DedA family protein [Heyndrickxia oleronia]MCI1764398.1 DedA family protein [Heyndrickxia oleronia]
MGVFIQSILNFLTDLGYFGVALGLMIEIIPSEIVLAYAGYLVSQGHINFVGAIIAGVIGGTIAQLFIYWIGAYGGRPFLKKYGKYIFIHERHIDIAEDWFNKYGSGVIFTARFIPVVRHAISIPAGITKMSLKKFTLYTTLAIIPWSILFVYLGDKLASNWKHVDEFAKPYIQPAMIIAIGLIMLYFIYKWIKKQKNK